MKFWEAMKLIEDGKELKKSGSGVNTIVLYLSPIGCIYRSLLNE